MFNLVTEEHRMMREAVRKLFTDLAAVDTQKRQRDNARIDSAAVGEALRDLGLFGTDADDASMASTQIQAIVALEAGAVALPFPVIETLATHAVMIRAVGAGEREQAYAMRTLASVLTPLSELPLLAGGQLHGAARLVPFADLADRVVIEARSGHEVVLVDVGLKEAGVVRGRRESVEPDYPVDDLRFEGIAASPWVAGRQGTVDSAAFLRQRTALLAAAEVAGACRRMVEMTRDYLLVRTQFGQLLGSYQSLKHRLADNHVRVEALVAAIDYAAAASDAEAVDAEACICAAKHFAGRAGKVVADSTLQMHGAIGYTMEFPLHLFMRRVHRLGVSYGSSRAQGERLFEIFREVA